MPDQLTPGQTAYNAYGATTNHLNYQGLPMPAWADLGDTIREAWENAATAIRDQALAEGADLIDQTDFPDDHIDLDFFDNGARWAANLLRSARTKED